MNLNGSAAHTQRPASEGARLMIDERAIYAHFYTVEEISMGMNESSVDERCAIRSSSEPGTPY
jgi:hypothetical protein